MEALIAIGDFLGQETTLPLWAMCLILLVIAFLTFALGSSIKGWNRALDMVAEWRQRYDTVLDVFYWQIQCEACSEEDDKKKK